MPLLKKASHVVVLTVQGGTVPGPTGEELARYLHRNGVLCEPITVQPEDRSTGEAILAHATSLQCDLLIKGAYTQRCDRWSCLIRMKALAYVTPAFIRSR